MDDINKKDWSNLYQDKKQASEDLSRFPETHGTVYTFEDDKIHFSRPSFIQVNEELHAEALKALKDTMLQYPGVGAGGVEPPVFTTSGHFAQEMRKLPMVVQQIVLELDNEESIDKFLGELERQGHAVAV